MSAVLAPAAPASLAMEAITDGVVVLDKDGGISYLNTAACRMFGTQANLALGKSLDELTRLEPDQSVRRQQIRDTEPAKERFHPDAKAMVLVAKRKRCPVDVLEVDAGSLGEETSRMLIVHDRSGEMALRDSIIEQARNDKLTGLLNRYELDRCLLNLVEDAETSAHTHAFLYIDLDQFKVVNDTCGHQAGDELLKMLGARLQKAVHHGDIVGRLGGDEFGVLLCHVDAQEAVVVAERICRVINSVRFAWGSYSFAVRASIGVSVINEHTRTPATVMRQVDSACYAAKEQGRNRVHLYTENDKQLAKRRGEMQWLSRINQALDEDRLRIVQQRIVPLVPGSSGEMAEILLRVMSPEGNEIAPGAFIPAAERYNLMPLLDRWVIHKTLSTLALNLEDSRKIERYTINLSGLSIGDPAFLGFILDEFASSGVKPSRIVFEVTETAAVASFSRAVRFMSLLREVGCQFALDDFGSGMSSFGYLRELPVDYLKIDGMFVTDLEVDPFHRAIVRSITEVDHAAGKKTIAEHVDSDAALKLLKEMGVDYVQGFFIERPVPFGIQSAA